MFDEQDLTAAETAGILTADQASRLRAFLSKRTQGKSLLIDPSNPAPAEQVADSSESLRFLTNFNDIFITIGIAILFVGLLAMFGVMFSGNVLGMATSGSANWAVPLILLPVAAIMWAMAEYFTAKRRLTLPSMALVCLFSLCIGASATALFSGIRGADADTFTAIRRGWSLFGNMGVAGFLGTAAAAAAFYTRFRLPFSLMIIALALAGAAYTFASFFGDIGLVIGGMASLAIGAVTFLIAMAFDARDPQRITRHADAAFWLHVAAAPQIILGIRGLATGSALGIPSGVSAVLVLALLLGLAVLSLAINRRALIVSGLFAFWLSLGAIVTALGGSGSTNFMITMLLLGTAIILLGGGWKTARRFVLSLVPKTPLTQRIFPPETS
jgi:hypothetical protein